MEAAAAMQVEELTSGASGRIIPVFRNLRRSILSYESFRKSLLLVHSFFVWILLLLPRRHRLSSTAPSPPSSPRAASSSDNLGCQWTTSLFVGVKRNALFCRSWFPFSGDLKGILIIIHGLNEHSGRYTHFAKQLISCHFGVYAMDWIGHGGSDGLHGYVPSLDHVVADTAAFLEKVKSEKPGVPCFLFGHSTGGAVVLKAASYPHIEEMLEGIILTSPALRVKPAHPIVGAVAPIFSMVVPRFQFKGANKRGIPVSRDPAALLAKYSDPLVYTGPIRVRTGHEILRISSYLMRNFQSITVPFFVLHGTADRVTDPLASQDLYNEAPSKFKDIKLYEGFLHDLLFEPEREEIAQDIIDWMEKRLTARYHENANDYW
ncbi:Lysophospholipase [Handroanthus impetiginosus]|uniref:Lysophospholipase n=1 Tax=Handroanthus impetiginosus TaxID=429701 RepID=A0A2G9I4M8_9LAMI|nr:Lysophospholipase [Handroanthus impetiginosus]